MKNKNGTRSPNGRLSVSRANRVTQAERRRLRQEVGELTGERDRFKKSFYALMFEPIRVPTFEEAMALVGTQPPLEDLIAELEAEGD